MTLLKNPNAEVLDGEARAEAAPQPQVFVRAFVTPPGAPWEQAKAAGLEARHGAPLPIADLMLKVKRLEPWKPGAVGRYGAFYVRIREYAAPFETTVEVDGRPHKVAFGTGAEQALRLRRLALGGGLIAAVVAVCAVGLTLVMAVRDEGEVRLENLEQQSVQRLKAASAYQRQKDLARDLEGAASGSGRLDDVLGDLAWVATSKSPEARIVAVHWERGVLAVEARGEVAPFSAPDRKVERFDKPLRPGVWLWGVGPRGSGEVHREIGP